MKSFVAEGFSNIALIKYMGKIEGTGNRPTNSSLSYTLPHLKTRVEITLLESEALGEESGAWFPLQAEAWAAPSLSEKGRQKFLAHARRLLSLWGVKNDFELRSANNFPSDCGLASSASSFAALTLAVAKASGKISAEASPTSLPTGDLAFELSRESRKGSGSSCRSMFSPWALWEEEGASPFVASSELQQPLLHAAVMIHAGVKAVSSSEAHVRVATSPRFKGRPERAQARLRELMSCLQENHWARAYEICRDEFIDMHELFETAQEPFRYRTTESAVVTDACQHIWNFKKDGPLVTMDAGPNIHLLFRPDQLELANKMVDHFRQKHMVLSSWRGFQ